MPGNHPTRIRTREDTNERRKDVPDEIVVIRLLVHGICEYCVGAWDHYVLNKAPPVSYNFSSPPQRKQPADADLWWVWSRRDGDNNNYHYCSMEIVIFPNHRHHLCLHILLLLHWVLSTNKARQHPHLLIMANKMNTIIQSLRPIFRICPFILAPLLPLLIIIMWRLAIHCSPLSSMNLIELFNLRIPVSDFWKSRYWSPTSFDVRWRGWGWK